MALFSAILFLTSVNFDSSSVISTFAFSIPLASKFLLASSPSLLITSAALPPYTARPVSVPISFSITSLRPSNDCFVPNTEFFVLFKLLAILLAPSVIHSAVF